MAPHRRLLPRAKHGRQYRLCQVASLAATVALVAAAASAGTAWAPEGMSVTQFWANQLFPGGPRRNAAALADAMVKAVQAKRQA